MARCHNDRLIRRSFSLNNERAPKMVVLLALIPSYYENDRLLKTKITVTKIFIGHFGLVITVILVLNFTTISIEINRSEFIKYN